MTVWIYRLKDFLQSRNGQITVFALATAGLFVFLANHMRQRRAAKGEVATRLPSITDFGTLPRNRPPMAVGCHFGLETMTAPTTKIKFMEPLAFYWPTRN